MGLHLGVNIDHVATLRQVRGTPYPDVLEAARVCKESGAQGITVHLREDRRHIQDADVYRLSEAGLLPLNLEMGNNPEILNIALQIKPSEVCLVPERRQELTTEGGLDVAVHEAALLPTVGKLRDAGVRVSLFVASDRVQLDAARRIGAPCVELHTGSFCDAKGAERIRELQRLRDGAAYASKLGLQVNAGHGINLENLPDILSISGLHTLNVGHSLIARALFTGLEGAVREMLAAMTRYPG